MDAGVNSPTVATRATCAKFITVCVLRKVSFCSFTLSDVDHSAHKFNEMAGRAQNRMTYDVNVPDGAIRMHDAVVRLPLCLLADSRLD